jgi:hypothetical protein
VTRSKTSSIAIPGSSERDVPAWRSAAIRRRPAVTPYIGQGEEEKGCGSTGGAKGPVGRLLPSLGVSL